MRRPFFMDWNIKKILDWATEYFLKKDVDAARLSAELLLGRALGLSRVQLYVQFDRPLNESELAAFKELVQRRASREPLAYILGEREFFSLCFEVSPAVLIPRPETEELVEHAINHLRRLNIESPRLLDVATGSGCIPIALLKNLPGARAVAFDLSEDALTVARKNAAALAVSDRCEFLQQDFRLPWTTQVAGPFDLITANPPYVASAEWETLVPEVRDREPKTALVPGESGFEAYAAILPQLNRRLTENGMAWIEIGMNQGQALLEMVANFCTDLSGRVHQDLSGRDRFLEIGRQLP